MSGTPFIDAARIDELLTFPDLIDALAAAFRGGFHAPQRHHHEIARDGHHAGTHLLMPAWTTHCTDGEQDFLGTKIVNVFPGNAARGLPAVLGVYVLQDGATGAPLAIIDGTRLTHWRTAAASALAARFLAREDATRLLMVGAGALAPFLVRAHASVRPIRRVTVWNHRCEGAERLAAMLFGEFDVTVTDDLESAVRAADIISCATLSSAPLLRGAWLQPGQHVDCVGAFNMAMREVDDEALRRASVFVDTPAALNEGGDVAIALRDGGMARNQVRGDLHGLCSGAAQGRTCDEEVTLFKSVGAAIEDLAAAALVYERAR